MNASSPKSGETSAAARRDLSVYDGRELLGHEEGGRGRASTWPDGRDPLGEWIRLDEAIAIALANIVERLR